MARIVTKWGRWQQAPPTQCRVYHNSSPSWRKPWFIFVSWPDRIGHQQRPSGQKVCKRITFVIATHAQSGRTESVFLGIYRPAFVHFLRPWPQSRFVEWTGFWAVDGRVFFSVVVLVYSKSSIRQIKINCCSNAHPRTLRQTDGMVRA